MKIDQLNFYCKNVEKTTKKSIHRPRPATQWTAMQQPGSSLNLVFNRCNHFSLISNGGGDPSGNSQSCDLWQISKCSRKQWLNHGKIHQNFDAFLFQRFNLVGRLANSNNVVAVVFFQFLEQGTFFNITICML